MSDQKKWISVAAVSASFIFALSAAPVIAHGPGHDDDHDMCKHCEKKMSKMDTDGDGKISRREFMKHHGEMFDKHDLNNDRFLDMDEIHWMMEDMHKHMHGDHDHDNGDGHGHGKDHDHNGGHGKGHGHGHENGGDHGHGHGHGNGHDHNGGHGKGHDHEMEESAPHGSHGDAKHGDHDDDARAQ